jgi:hypothetical protein
MPEIREPQADGLKPFHGHWSPYGPLTQNLGAPLSLTNDITGSEVGFSIDGGYVTHPRHPAYRLACPSRAQRINSPADGARPVASRATSSVVAAIANSSVL